jgi:TPR repeat protein
MFIYLLMAAFSALQISWVGSDAILAITSEVPDSTRQGNSYGQIALGQCLIEGIGVRADPVKGAALVRQAADRSETSVEFSYGGYLERGIGFAKDMSAAAVCYRRAMEQGHPSARSAYERCSRGGEWLTEAERYR